MFTPREHPDGGYQLLSPHGGFKLRLLCADWDGKKVAKRSHEITLWEFIGVQV